MNKYCFLDMDGTLVDTSHRFYAVYLKILSSNGYPALKFDEYWNHRKRGAKTKEILLKTCDKDFVYDYYNLRNEEFEKWENIIQYDTRIVDYSTLEVLKSCRYKLIVVSLRSDFTNLRKELDHFGIFKYIDEINVGPQFGDYMDKYRIMKKYKQIDKNSMIIGDTEIDILAGNKLGLFSIAVTSGIRTKEDILKFKPNMVLNNINNIEQLVKR